MPLSFLNRVKPALIPPLDPNFKPAALYHRLFDKAARDGQPYVIGLERNPVERSRFEFRILPDEHPLAEENLFAVERVLKFLLWQRSGWRIYLGGPAAIGRKIQSMYTPGGLHHFDDDFIGRQVYERPLEFVLCQPEDVPPACEPGRALGRHLEGCRIGFDLGASDRKVSAVIDGKAVYSEEVVWEPKKQSDPEYHYQEISQALRSASAHLPRVDAIGGSSSGIMIDNHPKAGNMFRGIPAERMPEIRRMYERIQRDWNVPLEVINDGEVTALAGSMSLEVNAILGIALGSSEASGYIDPAGRIKDWLNELCFAPVDYNPDAIRDEWSGDAGCGASYFSQQAVFHLAPAAGIAIPDGMTDAARLQFVQALLESGNTGAEKIWATIGIHLGYGLAHYARFYDLEHVLILGRVTSGRGGSILLDHAHEVLDTEFPELARRISLQLPDEHSRRVGQSIAAASLPKIKPLE